MVRQCVLGFAVIAMAMACTAQAQDPRPPNIVVIFADDLGLGDVGPGGSTLIKTPRLDQMAREGVVLENFYSCANVCTPSRGGLLTGRFPIRLNVAKDVARPTNAIGLSPWEITTAEALRERGYATALFGKWHLGHRPEHWPTNHGFDYFYGVPYSNDMLPFALYRMDEKIEEPVDQSTLTRRYTEEAIKFIESNRDKPFYAYIPHNMPHVPLFVSDEFKGHSEAGLYGDVVEELDANVGRVIDAIGRLGLAENTLIVFTSDNGPWWEGSAGGLRDRKGSSWDGGLRVPFVARWKGTLPEGKRFPGIAMNIDLHPTFLALAGAAPATDRPMDGMDITALLRDGAASPHESLLMFDGERIAGIRTQQWKLVVRSWYRSYDADLGRKGSYYPEGLLFDLDMDPGERYSFTREHPEIAKDLRARIDKAMTEVVAAPESK